MDTMLLMTYIHSQNFKHIPKGYHTYSLFTIHFSLFIPIPYGFRLVGLGGCGESLGAGFHPNQIIGN